MRAIEEEVRSSCCVFAETQQIRERILYAFQERGYFKAQVGTPSTRVLKNTGGRQSLAVAVSVQEGQQYKLKTIAINGAKVFPNAQLRSQFAIADGDIFDTDRIRAGLKGLRKLYVSQSTAMISLWIDVNEGKQFHFRFGRLVLYGEEPRAGTSAKLLDAWAPYEGKSYDPKLVDQFWQSVRTLLPPDTQREKTLEMLFEWQREIVIARIELPDVK